MRDGTINHQTLTAQDVASITIGSAVLSFPVAAAGETWDLGEELSALRVAMLSLGSVFFVGVFVYLHYKHDRTSASLKDFAIRVAATYLVTLVVSALILHSIDRLGLFAQPRTLR